MDKKNLQLKLQEKIMADLNSLFKTNEYKSVLELKKNKLVEFDYLKSTSINKIKFLCHNSLNMIQNLVQNFLTIGKENPLMDAIEKTHYQIQKKIEKLEIDKKNSIETNSNLQKKIKSITPLLENLKAFNNDLIDSVDNIVRENDQKIKKFLSKKVQKFNKDKSIHQRIRNSFKNIENLLIKNFQGPQQQDNTLEKQQLMTNASLEILTTFQQYLILHQNCDVTNSIEGRPRSMSPYQDNQTIKKGLIDTNSQLNENSENFQLPQKFDQSERQKKETIKSQRQQPMNIKSGSKKMLLQTAPLRPQIQRKKNSQQKISNSQTQNLNNDNKFELTLRLIKENKNDDYQMDKKKKNKLVNQLKDFTNNFLNITISSDEENFLLDNDQIQAIKDIIKKKQNSQGKKDISKTKANKQIKSKSKKKKIQTNKSLQPLKKDNNKSKFYNQEKQSKKKEKQKKIEQKDPNESQQNQIKNSQLSKDTRKEVTLINYNLKDFLN